jgi:hypothetical protein
MKMFLTVLVLVCGQICFASSTERQMDALMSSFDVNPERFDSAVNAAKISVDEINETIRLTVRFEGAQRPLIAEQVITLPIVDKYVGNCGTIVFVAQKPSRAIGSPMETMIVTDYSKIVCRMIIPADEMTTVQLGDVVKGESEELINPSIFTGFALQPSF